MAIEDGRVVGFIAISIHTKEFFKQFLKTKVFSNLHLIPFATFGKIFFIKSLEVLKYPFSNKITNKIFISNSEIFNFCVDGCQQGQGVGKLLFSKAIKQLEASQIKTLKIVTGQMQVNAQRFYYKSGATLSHRIMIHKGEESMVFKYKIN